MAKNLSLVDFSEAYKCLSAVPKPTSYEVVMRPEVYATLRAAYNIGELILARWEKTNARRAKYAKYRGHYGMA